MVRRHALLPDRLQANIQDILSTTTTNKVLTKLMTKIEQGFPETKAELEQEVQPYWPVKDMLSAFKGVIYMGDRVVVPDELRSRTLDTLNAAHQGTTSMMLRAERNLFWPIMARDTDIRRGPRVHGWQHPGVPEKAQFTPQTDLSMVPPRQPEGREICWVGQAGDQGLCQTQRRDRDLCDRNKAQGTPNMPH